MSYYGIKEATVHLQAWNVHIVVDIPEFAIFG